MCFCTVLLGSFTSWINSSTCRAEEGLTSKTSCFSVNVIDFKRNHVAELCTLRICHFFPLVFGRCSTSDHDHFICWFRNLFWATKIIQMTIVMWYTHSADTLNFFFFYLKQFQRMKWNLMELQKIPKYQKCHEVKGWDTQYISISYILCILLHNIQCLNSY